MYDSVGPQRIKLNELFLGEVVFTAEGPGVERRAASEDKPAETYTSVRFVSFNLSRTISASYVLQGIHEPTLTPRVSSDHPRIDIFPTAYVFMSTRRNLSRRGRVSTMEVHSRPTAAVVPRKRKGYLRLYGKR